MIEDFDIDDAAHNEMLRQITEGKVGDKKQKKSADIVGAGELLNAIKSTKNVKKPREALGASKKAKKPMQKTLQAPLHRLEVEKIHRTIGFDELQKDLEIWEPIVNEQKSAEHLSFPLNKEIFKVETAAESNEGFIPRTPLEKAMEAVLATSKHNLTNASKLTEAEQEIVKAMDAEQAKEKLANLQKMRALQSYQEAKFRRMKKIKSKNYHRIMKRTQRRQQLKEFDDLVVRDPDAAKAKLEELEKDRVFERATLKHRSQNKFSKVLAKHASNDVNARKLMDDHIRFGKEMKEKIGMKDSDEEMEEDDADQNTKDLVEEAAEQADILVFDEEETKRKILNMRKEKMKKAKDERLRGVELEVKEAVKITEEVAFGEEEEVDNEKNTEEEENGKKEKKKKEKLTFKEKRKRKAEAKTEEERAAKVRALEGIQTVDIDEMFDKVENIINKKGSNPATSKKETKTGETTKNKEKRKKRRRSGKKGTDEEKKKDKNEPSVDAMLDPSVYLTAETAKLNQVTPILVEGDDLIEDNENEGAMADAFAGDDVMTEFRDEKEEREELEREKDRDLTLLGWGSWTGPGINDKKKKKFVVKAKERKRKDKGKMGIIIHEGNDDSITKLQPKHVPFPFTRADDFEANLAHPIGKEWNCLETHKAMTKPAITTQGGRVILPMSKDQVLQSMFTKEVR